MWIKVNDKKLWSVENVLNLIFCVLLTLAGWIAAVLSFLDAIQVIKL